MRKRIYLGRLLGRKVYDPSGRCAGRIEEVRAVKKADGSCEVREYLLGRQGLLERLSIAGAAGLIVNRLGGYGAHASHRVNWDQMDLSNPEHPRIRCAIEELKSVNAES